MNKVIGILAHVDAGKTTFSEQILYHSKSIRTRGRVDYKNTFLDNHKIEKERGITIFSNQAVFNYNDNKYFLIDTPGHIDFSSEMERTIKVMDYAIIVVSAVEGVESHTETIWKLLENNYIPTFFFINKVDREGADINITLNQIKQKLNKDCFIINDLEEISLIEKIAELNDDLFELYINGNYNTEIWIKVMKKLIKESKFFPCFYGSALLDSGIEYFLNCFDLLTYTENEKLNNNDFTASVFKVKHDEQNNRITFIKVNSGSLKVKDEVKVGIDKDNNCVFKKVNQIRIYNGSKYTTTNIAETGQICAITGFDNVKIGTQIGSICNSLKYEIIPMLRVKVIYDRSIGDKNVLNMLELIEDEEPLICVKWNEHLKEISLNIMGTIQLEVLKEIMLQRFNIVVEFGKCEILYKETILNTVIGYGHFEPLRHYAEVHFKIEPIERNNGIKFKSNCHIDVLDESYQSLIENYIFSKEHKGVLIGSALTDVLITLINGRAHLKHTSGGDFKEATYRAIRQGLEQAESIILEPIYRFTIYSKSEYAGRIISDIKKMYGTFESPEIIDDNIIISGRVPVSKFMNYNTELISFTKGTGHLSCVFDKYDICHNPSEVIENNNYDKERDIENTSTSIFCAKGSGYPVKWNDVHNFIHCK